jgi:hypothetical protein
MEIPFNVVFWSKIKRINSVDATSRILKTCHGWQVPEMTYENIGGNKKID